MSQRSQRPSRRGGLPSRSSKAPGGNEEEEEDRNVEDPKIGQVSEVPAKKTEEASESEEYDGSDDDGSDDDSDDSFDINRFNKRELIEALGRAEKQYNGVHKRLKAKEEKVDRLEEEAARTKVKHATLLASKDTRITNLTNKVKTCTETNAANKLACEKKFRDRIDLLEEQLKFIKKKNADIGRERDCALRDQGKKHKEVEVIKTKLSFVNLSFIEKNREYNLLLTDNKKLQKDLLKKEAIIKKNDHDRLMAQVEIEHQRTERTRLAEAERTARLLLEQKAKESDHKKKKELLAHSSSLRLKEKRKVREEKSNKETKKRKKQEVEINTHLSELMRSAPGTTLPNNGRFMGNNSFMQMLQQVQKQADLVSSLAQLQGSSMTGDDESVAAQSFATQPSDSSPPPITSPPATNRQLTLTQMDRDGAFTPPPVWPRRLPPGVTSLRDDASGSTVYMVLMPDGSKNIYMTYDEMMDAVSNLKQPAEVPTRDGCDGASNMVTPNTTFDSQISELTNSQPLEEAANEEEEN